MACWSAFAAGALSGCSEPDKPQPPAAEIPKSSANAVKAMEPAPLKPASTVDSVESLLASIDAISKEQKSIEIFVPSALTIKGESVPSSLAMAVVVDNLLRRGYTPQSSEERPGGRLIKAKLGP